MLTAIDEAIQNMRDAKVTITKKALAEELGVSERAMYADYISNHLFQYVEFNPNLPKQNSFASSDLIKECQKLRLQNREYKVKVKELSSELEKSKQTAHPDGWTACFGGDEGS